MIMNNKMGGKWEEEAMAYCEVLFSHFSRGCEIKNISG